VDKRQHRVLKNYGHRVLSTNEEKVLSLGLKFASTPRTVPK